MKSDKLQDAIGLVDSDLVARAGKASQNKKKRTHIKWTAPIAAALAVIIGLGVFFSLRDDSPVVLSAYALAEAEYPEMAKYPEGEILPGFDKRYEAWREDRVKQRGYMGAGEDLDSFFQTTASEFLTDSEGENLVYSPLNVYMALAMLSETTDGNSRQQLLDLLGAEDIDSLRTQAHAIWNANYSDDGAVTSILASSLWLNENLQFNRETLNTLANTYYASTYQGKMGSAEFNKALQSWLNEQTGGLLSDYISDIEMDARTVMTLATTIYFQVKWTAEFSENDNTKDVFHGAKSNITCDFMNCTESYGTYYWGEKFGATGKKLQESGYMWFILPDEGVSTDDLLSDKEALSFITANGEWEQCKDLKVNLSVPKFDVSSKLNLAKGLQNLGVTDCFDFSTADFSPLCDEDVFLSEVDHGARVAIDEEGVTATAYTEMRLSGAGMPPEDEIDFVLDRPFIFVITSYDGLPLFVGVINQP